MASFFVLIRHATFDLQIWQLLYLPEIYKLMVKQLEGFMVQNLR